VLVILSNPLVLVEVGLVIDENTTPLFIRVPNNITLDNYA
jgi:hypothetical protein